jgi:hypothetical protein
MKYRYLILGCFLLYSCEKKYEVTISGTVTDEVTQELVAGANVGLETYYCMDGRCYSDPIPGTITTTGADGSYSINYIYYKEDTDDNPFPERLCAYAIKSGYIGSDLHYLNDKIYINATVKLFHSADLNIHVKNEGIYNLDAIKICLDKGVGFSFFGTPEFTIRCIGADLDTVYSLKRLWANYSYNYKLLRLNAPTGGPGALALKFSSIQLKPDIVNEFNIAF